MHCVFPPMHCTVPYCFTVMYSTVQIFQHNVLYCNVYDVLYCTVFQGHSAVLDRLPAHVRQGINKRYIAQIWKYPLLLECFARTFFYNSFSSSFFFPKLKNVKISPTLIKQSSWIFLWYIDLQVSWKRNFNQTPRITSRTSSRWSSTKKVFSYTQFQKRQITGRVNNNNILRRILF